MELIRKISGMHNKKENKERKYAVIKGENMLFFTAEEIHGSQMTSGGKS